MSKFKTLQEVTHAIDNGHLVYWKSKGYEVIDGGVAGYLIRFRGNGHAIGLFWADGVTSDHKAEDFIT